MLIHLLVNLLFFEAICSPPIHEFEGFGSDMGIKIYEEVVVTNELSFKNAIKPHTSIKIINTTIKLQQVLWIKEMTDIIIQGPATLTGFGIYIENSSNIILYNLRISNSSIYGVLVYNSSNVVLDSLTILDASRSSIDQGKCVDITEGASNVTVSRSIFGYRQFSDVEKYKGMLIANFLHDPVTNVSIHHNIFYQNYQRSPEISTPGLFDFKNNIIYGYTVYGSRIRESAYGNFQQNYYIGGKKDPLVFIDTSRQLAYSRNNKWKFNYETWQNITDLGQNKYSVPFVTAYNYSSLISNLSSWGCSQTEIQRQIKKQIIDSSKIS